MVSIIPKPVKRIPKWQNIALFSSSALLILVVLAYVFLMRSETQTSNALSELEDKLAQVGTKEDKAMEIKLLSARKKINDFADLFEEHKKSSNFFEFLETICHPQAWFSSIDVDVDEAKVLISGKTATFQTLEQQVFIFRKQTLIQETDLSNIAVGEEGDIEFGFSLSLDPQIFK